MVDRSKDKRYSNALDLFGVKEVDAQKTVDQAVSVFLKGETMEDVADALDIHNAGMIGFKCFTFGRMVEQNEHKMNKSSDKHSLQLIAMLAAVLSEDGTPQEALEKLKKVLEQKQRDEERGRGGNDE